MQILTIKKGSCLPGHVIVPTSKSYANRALILGAILKNSPGIKNLPKATDVTILINSLREVGLKIQIENNIFRFTNSFPECEVAPLTHISVGEGGTTARFFAAMLLLGKSEYTLILGERLKQRPWQEFLDIGRSLGAKCELVDNKLIIQGPINLEKVVKIDCSKTTQFASAFQLLGIGRDTQIIPMNMVSSQSYWAMTEKMLAEFNNDEVYEIPMDWSSASYPMAFAALNQNLQFPDLRPDPWQADSKLMDVLLKFNCLEVNSKGISVSPIREQLSVKLNVSDSLDLVPTLAYLLSHIEGQHQLTGIENLVHKESDRLEEVIKLLGIFKRKAQSDGRVLFIEGSSHQFMDEVDLLMPDDHRMVMVGSLFLLQHGGGTIGPAEAVNKSYPGFFELISF
jgi:3-phosphoshikimate 1-carboxyvinyltransferase